MSNSTVFKSPAACTDVTLPRLFRDPGASDGSLFLYDALDPYSWPSQAAPSGAAQLIDLLDLANASIAAPAMGWAGGFVFSNDDQDLITLPTSSRFPADAEGFAISFWLKLSSVAAGIAPLLGMVDNSNATTQYGLYRDGANIVPVIDGLSLGLEGVSAGQVYQMAFTGELVGAEYAVKFWLNGVLEKSALTAAPLFVPTATNCRIGTMSWISVNGDAFTLYRVHADDLSTRTAEEFVTADYNAGFGRFA